MKKLAVFVEGYTELIFAERLIEEIAGRQNVLIEKRTIRGGTTVPRTMIVLESVRPQTEESFYVLLVDCQGDSQVVTRIKEEHSNLTASGYTKIIGLRDVRPTFSHADIPRLLTTLPANFSRDLIPVDLVLAVLEIEAWFLAEHTHFHKVNSSITVESIVTHLGFNPRDDDMTLRLEPTKDITDAYAIGGASYVKGGETIKHLDYSEIYLVTSEKIPQLKQLTVSIDNFLS